MSPRKLFFAAPAPFPVEAALNGQGLRRRLYLLAPPAAAKEYERGNLVEAQELNRQAILEMRQRIQALGAGSIACAWVNRIRREVEDLCGFCAWTMTHGPVPQSVLNVDEPLSSRSFSGSSSSTSV